jgi:hypothetical protein
MKRGAIAKALKLSPDEVTKIIERFKKDLRRVVEKLESDEQLAQLSSVNYD